MARDRASRPEAKPLRLFVAVDVPASVREAIDGSIAPWRDRFPRARWVPSGNWHVTLKFLGRTWPRLVDWVRSEIDLVARTEGPFETAVEGLGVFPSPRRARVLWAGLADGEGRFVRLADGLSTGLAREFEPEKRAFTPHLTLARFDPPVAVEEELPGVPSEGFRVERLVLYRSRLQRPAPVYEVLASFPLRGSG